MIKITFGSDEVKSAFVCKLRDLGIDNINEDSVSVSIKSIRDGSGGSEAEVEFEQGVQVLSQHELVEAIKPVDDTNKDTAVDTEEESSSTGSGLFTGGETS